jgi:hypothetical protein
VMPLAEKSTVSKVCLTKGKLRNRLTRYIVLLEQ